VIRSKIDVYEARRIKEKALQDYKNIADSIKDAASRGEDGVLVPDIDSFQIRERLRADKFSTTTMPHGDWIYWG